jgi:mitogen-activated protein kinase organizer 1
VNAVRYSRDGNYCMTCGDDRSLRLWNPVKPGQADNSKALLIKTYTGVHGYGILDLCIASDNSKFASVGGDRAGFFWDVSTGRIIRKLQGHTSRINTVAYNDDNTVLLTGSYDKTVCAWDLRSSGRVPIQTLETFSDSVSSIACTPSQIIAGSVDGCLRVFDLRAGYMHCDTLQDSITHVSLTADSRCVVSSCIGSVAQLSDIFTGKVLQSYKGHKSESYKVEIRPMSDDKSVVGGSEDGSLYRWDYVSGRSLGSFKAHSRCLTSIATHPSCSDVLTASVDGTVKLWSL